MTRHGPWTTPGLIWDLSRAEFDEEGVRNFYWPLARGEVLAVRDQLIRRLVSFTSPESSFPFRSALALSVLFKFVLLEALVRYQAVAIERRWSRKDPGAAVSSCWSRAQGPLGQVRHQLRRGPARGKPIPIWLKRIVRDLQWNGLISPFSRVLKSVDPVMVVDPPPLLVAHARTTDTPIRFSAACEWFGSVKGDVTDLEAEHERLSGALAAATRQAFPVGSEEFPDPELRSFGKAVRECLALVTYHLDSARNRERFPQELWHGSGGNPWTAMLSYLVREAGGQSLAFDHGHGNGYMLPNTRQFVEFPHCDTFVTYNQAQANAINELTDKTRLIRDHMPRIVATRRSPSDSRVGDRSGERHRAGPLRRIMYVSTIYPRHRVHLFPLLSDIVALDWQARLFARLHSWGLELIHKPHPQGALCPPRRLQEYFGHELVMGSFEEVMNQADAFLFDYPFSTTFPVALMSDRPVYLVDFEYPSWLPEARSQFERRCTVIRGWLDRHNRAQVDWETVHDALRADRLEWKWDFVRSFHS